MIKRILMAYDGSAPADKAYAFALDLAKKYGADVHVIAVARPPDFGDDVETEAILENSVKHYEGLFAPLKDQAAAQGLNPQFEVVVGHPAEQIIYRAEEYQADLIVMGHRGKSLFERLRLGSVSKHVIHYAHCAVTIVR
ncbi:MAG TPA: universal stress protein [Burkholderiales bacterium]|nr:universal stress protein [Burkholderiales bacterium]